MRRFLLLLSLRHASDPLPDTPFWPDTGDADQTPAGTRALAGSRPAMALQQVGG